MNKTLVIFDIDGTLLYSNKVDSQCFAEVYFSIYKKEFPTIDWSKFPHVTDETIFKTVINQHFDREPTAAEKDYFRDSFVELLRTKRQEKPDEFRQVPGAKTAFENLKKDADFLVGIGTGGWKKPARLKLRHLDMGLEDVADAYADGNYTREGILKESIGKAEAMGVGFNRIVYVGDAKWDVKTTRNMGLPFVGIRREGNREVLLEIGAKDVLVDFSDYDRFVAAIRGAEVPSIV